MDKAERIVQELKKLKDVASKQAYDDFDDGYIAGIISAYNLALAILEGVR